MQPEGGQSGLRRPAVAVLGVLALLVAIVALAAVFGLGPFDDDEGSSNSGEQLSKAEFIAKGDAICRKAHEQSAELQKSAPKSADDTATLIQNLIEISENELAAIKALNAPPRVQAALGTYLQSREQVLGLLKKALQAAQDEDLRAYVKAQAASAASQVRRTTLARAVGFTQCSRVRVQGGTGP
jgi:hypothetical protein